MGLHFLVRNYKLPLICEYTTTTLELLVTTDIVITLSNSVVRCSKLLYRVP